MGRLLVEPLFRFLRAYVDLLAVAGVVAVVWFVAWSRSVEDSGQHGYYPPLPLPLETTIARAHMAPPTAAATTQPFVAAE